MHLGQQADALLVHQAAQHAIDLRAQALRRLLRNRLDRVAHAHGHRAFGQVDALGLQQRHSSLLQVRNLNDVQNQARVFPGKTHGLVKRRASGRGTVERNDNRIVQHGNPSFSGGFSARNA